MGALWVARDPTYMTADKQTDLNRCCTHLYLIVDTSSSINKHILNNKHTYHKQALDFRKTYCKKNNNYGKEKYISVYTNIKAKQTIIYNDMI